MINQPTFEENLNKLDTTVNALERGELPLADALKAFEDGMKLLKTCQNQLAEVQLQVSKVINAAGDTQPVNVA
jgi:exodeoxyribonuclease VII small subunit